MGSDARQVTEMAQSGRAGEPQPRPLPSTADSPPLLLSLFVHALAIATAAATLYLAAQPIYANDTWIHLALGEHFLRHGPWLDADPHLFAAPGPPSPASWLGAAAFFAIQDRFGFPALRAFHALLVALILVLVWKLQFKAVRSATFASTGLVAFIVLSTYRLVQLRPELFTIAACLLLHPLVLAPRHGPSRRATLAAALLTLVWSNVHPAFALGPLLVLGTAAAVAAASFVLPTGVEPDGAIAPERRRAARLGWAGVAMTVAGTVNPLGPSAYAAYFDGERDNLPLAAVRDEWNATNLLAWPTSGTTPSIAAWLVAWLCVAGVVLAGVRFVMERRRADRATAPAVDPGLLAAAVAGMAAAAVASRFLWMASFAFPLLARALPRATSPVAWARARNLAASAACTVFVLLAVPLHFELGDWPMVSRFIGDGASAYADDYPTEKYSAHAAWFLADTGVTGRLFNDYPLGGFLSFWLAPELSMSSSGTMNVSREAMDINLAIADRRPLPSADDYPALLDTLEIDLFLGVGLPIAPSDARPVPSTVRHLEHEPGWLLVFRNLRSAVYLRRNDRNRANLERIEAYYAFAGVPFDRERGFDVERVITRSTEWATDHGLIPLDFRALVETVRDELGGGQAGPAAERLASIYAVLGAYDRAIRLDRLVQQVRPGDPASGMRLIWSLVQSQQLDAAIRSASELEERIAPGSASSDGSLTGTLHALARADAAARARSIALQPLLDRHGIEMVRARTVPAPVRARRDDHGPQS